MNASNELFQAIFTNQEDKQNGYRGNSPSSW